MAPTKRWKPVIGGDFDPAGDKDTRPQVGQRAADRGLVDHDAREIMRCRIDADNVITMVHDSLPALIPPSVRNASLVGTHLGDMGAETFRALAVAAIAEAREWNAPTRAEWASMLNGRPRIAVFVPHPTGSVTMRVFAEADEADAVVPNRRNTGTDGGE